MTDSSRSTRAPRALRPFLVGQYRILAGALTLSLLGGGMWLVALVFQVQALGGGPVELSLAATCSAVGMLAATLLGGVLADRIPQKRILVTIEIVKTVAIGAAAALGLAGALELWHLASLAFLIGVTEGFFYPAYSALLPAILPADQLLAANGVEGMLRPAALQAVGPALAGVAVAVWNPPVALAAVAVIQALGAVVLATLRSTPVRREFDGKVQHPVGAFVTDIAEGFRYMLRTGWLLATLLFACLLILVIMGPIEVLLPFVITRDLGGGPGDYALALAAFGLGGVLGSMLAASFRLPRRYLTVMNLAWGFGCVPLALIAIAQSMWVVVIALFMVGVTFSIGQVIWGTLLQRRVPPHLLGRVSSLDFFVSLALMPVSMALAGPVGEAIGLGPAFVVAGLVPPVLAVAAILIWRLGKDEIAHPLEPQEESADRSGTQPVASDRGDS